MKNQKVFNISMFYGVPSVKDTYSWCIRVLFSNNFYRITQTCDNRHVGLYLVLYCYVNLVISQVFIFHFVSLKCNVKTAT